MKRIQTLATALALLLVAFSAAFAQDHPMPLNASELAWGPVPPFLPPGAEITVLDGNPAEEVPITLRLRMPAGYVIPPHWHPTLENVTVLSGILHVGMGDVLDQESGTALEHGGFVALLPDMNHFVWAEGETIVQVHLNGPFAITYADPADDPRNQ